MSFDGGTSMIGYFVTLYGWFDASPSRGSSSPVNPAQEMAPILLIGILEWDFHLNATAAARRET